MPIFYRKTLGRPDSFRTMAKCSWLPLLLGGLLCAQDSQLGPRVQELYSQAQAAKSRGDLTTSIDKYRAILALAPDFPVRDLPRRAKIYRVGRQGEHNKTIRAGACMSERVGVIVWAISFLIRSG